ncbi:MFS transporter [Streptomyces sp. NPDC001027]|uniref:MFS transporter n=1 Tax=Streptomyces sp. NPDC001027 TaxID=3154771 RepID=UPI00331B3904
MTLLFAMIGGFAVGNLYWAQPLLKVIANDLGVSTGTAGTLVTLTQIGYAVGIVLIVPLGDVANRRRLIPLMLALSVVALLACAAAPTFTALLGALAVLGLTTVAGQIVIPLAGDLADDASRGRIVGTVMTGFLAGTIVSRTLSGLVAQVAGWRAIYVVAAVVIAALTVIAYRKIPELPAPARMRYPALLASVGSVVRRHRAVRWNLVLSALQFGLFMMFWTALTFLLSDAPFSYSPLTIGMLGLFGLLGAVAAQHTGKLHDRGWSMAATGAGWALALITMIVAALGQHSLLLIIVSVVLLHFAIFPMNVLISARLFAVVAEGRARVNTAVIAVNFIAGAIGSALVGPLWTAGGWHAVTGVGIGLSVAGLLLWTIGRRGALGHHNH